MTLPSPLLSDYAARWRGTGVALPAKASHLKNLEAESIEILRETAASFERPVLLYSIGKDSTTLLHLALKAFWPFAPPFALLHIDSL